MNILTISYGRHLFDLENYERYRMEMCAREVDALHMIVFSLRTHGLETVQSGNLILHPTNSRYKLLIPFDAIRLGLHIVKDAQWKVTVQDPFETGFVGWVIRLFTGAHLNIQEHGDVFSTTHWRDEKFGNVFRYYFGLWLLRRADSARVVSERIRAALIAKGVPPERIKKLPVCIQTESFRTAQPHDFGAGVIIISVGRFVKQKNLLMLVDAFACVYEKYPDAQLVLVGRGPEEEAVRKQIATHGIEEAVTIYEWSDNVAGLMRGADVYALSSNYEGWGRVLLEAMLAGLPTVTTDVGAAGEVLQESVHGFVVPIGDTERFAEKLADLVSDAEKRAEYGRRARADVEAVLQDEASYARAWRDVFVETEGGTV